MALTPDPTTYNQQAPTREGMFDKDGRLTKPWLMWFHQQFVATGLLQVISQGVTDGSLASAFDERNPVAIEAAVEDAVLQTQPDTPRNFQQEIDDALKQAQPETPRDFTPAIQDAETLARESSRPEVTSGQLADIQNELAFHDIANPRAFLYDGDGNPISSTSGALDVNLKSSSITLPVSGTVSISGTVPVSEATLDATIAATGAAVPSKTQQVGGSDGADLRTFATDTSGRQKVLLYDAAGNAITSTSGALDENFKLLGGTAVDVNSGNKSAGTQRVVLATDQPQLTNKFLTQDAADGTVGSAIPSIAVLVAAENAGGNLGPLQSNLSGALLVSDVSAETSLGTLAGTVSSGKQLTVNYALGSGDVVIPVQISTKIKASGAFGTSATAVTLVTAPSGQRYYLTGIKFDVDPSVFFATAFLVTVSDSTDGVLAQWVVWPPASAPSAPATPLILTYNSPAGLFYKPSATATTLSCRVNNALSGAYLYITVDYGLTSL